MRPTCVRLLLLALTAAAAVAETADTDQTCASPVLPDVSDTTWGDEPHVLVTGGAGYIGSHTVLLLLEAGYQVTVVDNLVNSNPESLNRVAELTGKGDHLKFFNLDTADGPGLAHLLGAMPSPPILCIHFAGLKAVGESTQIPLLYYGNNVGGTVVLLEELQKAGVRRIIFSSSATVYGNAVAPITEDSPVGQGITNAYGRSKYVIEEILNDFAKSPNGQEWGMVILRYFNPVGAHPSGRIGEDPSGKPNNLMPFVSQVAVGRRPHLSVYGDDYDTPDGTGVRDYIHVMDLAEGHLAALRLLEKQPVGTHTVNLGTGSGYSVLDMVAAMKSSCECEVPYKIEARRPGDLATVYAATDKAKELLGWTAKLDLKTMCDDLWRWQSTNPQGYGELAAYPRGA